MYDPAALSQREIAECCAALRVIGQGAKSLEEVSRRIVDYLFANFADHRTGEPSIAVNRFSVTQEYHKLPADLRACAQGQMKGTGRPAGMKCLVTLAIRGQRPELNDRRNAGRYRAIPLISEEAVKQIPLTALLIKQLGIEINTALSPDPALLLNLSERNYNVFCVEDVTDSPFEPPRDELTLKLGAKSIVGFGGMLPTGEIFSSVLFMRHFLPRAAAESFVPLALSVKTALIPLADRVFDEPS